MISKIILENFMNIAFTEIEGKEGINAYIGTNGAGKSSVFEAIAFVFLDRKKGDSFKDYIKLGEKSARVQLEWLIGTEPCFFDYEISRSSGTVSRSIQFKDTRYTSSEDCQRFLSEHFDLKMLKDIVFNMQDSETIITMTPADRREILQKVFNVNFEQGVAALKKDQDIVDEKLKLTVMKKKILSEKKYNYTTPEPIPDEASYPDYIQGKVEAETKLATIIDISDIKNRVTSQNTIVTQLTQQRQEIETRITTTTVLSKKVLSDIDTEMTAIGKFTVELSSVDIEIDLLSKEHNDNPVIPSEKISDLDKKIADSWGQQSLLQKQLAMNKKGLCDSCGQTCDPKHTGELETQLAQKTLVLSGITEERILLKEKQTKAQEVFNSFVRKNQDKSLIQEKKKGKESLLQSYLVQKDTIEKSIFEARAKKVELDIQETAALELYRQYCVELSEKNKAQEEIVPLKQKILDFTVKINKIDSSRIVNIERLRMNTLLEEQEKLDKVEIESLTVAEQGCLDEISLFKQTKTILESVLPDFIIAQGCLILENFINEFIISTGIDLRVKLVAESTAKKSKGVQFYYLSHMEGSSILEVTTWLSVSMASGYEAAILTLAFKLAVAFMYNSDILLLDEPDKAATDENSLALFKHIVNLEGFKQVFLISHRLPLIDWIKSEADAHIYRVENGVFEEAV